MTHTHKARRPQRAMAARQALALCEADISPGWHNPGLSQRTTHARSRSPRTSTARGALLAVGLPPPIAAALRRRLQLLPDQENQP